MCFSMYTQYQQRPVVEDTAAAPVQRPVDAPPTQAELDDNLFGPKPTPPEWQTTAAPDNGHSHHTHAAAPAATVVATDGNGGSAIASVNTQTVEAVVVELANGTKLLICPL